MKGADVDLTVEGAVDDGDNGLAHTEQRVDFTWKTHTKSEPSIDNVILQSTKA